MGFVCKLVWIVLGQLPIILPFQAAYKRTVRLCRSANCKTDAQRDAQMDAIVACKLM